MFCFSMTLLALRPNCSTAALAIPQMVLSNSKLVEPKMLDYSDTTKTGIFILTLATYQSTPLDLVESLKARVRGSAYHPYNPLVGCALPS